MQRFLASRGRGTPALGEPLFLFPQTHTRRLKRENKGRIHDSTIGILPRFVVIQVSVLGVELLYLFCILGPWWSYISSTHSLSRSLFPFHVHGYIVVCYLFLIYQSGGTRERAEALGFSKKLHVCIIGDLRLWSWCFTFCFSLIRTMD